MKKINILSCLSIYFLSILFHLRINAQPQLCISTPTTSDEFVECNKTIALTFAPKYVQWASDCPSNAFGIHTDRILKVNFDNDFIGDNNWENVATLDFFLQPPPDELKPRAYYTVLWTHNYWLITYSYYYPRDYANGNPCCADDEHESDLQRVVVIVRRPTNSNFEVEELIEGVIANHHSSHDTRFCDISEILDVVTEYPPTGTSGAASGAHPTVYSSAGSHGLYFEYNEAYTDSERPILPIILPFLDLSFYCKPKPNKIITYRPSVIPELFGQCTNGCPGGCLPWSVSNNLPASWLGDFNAHEEFYSLIDIFDLDEGLWLQRNNFQLVNEDATKFVSDNSNGGCFVEPKFASTPWSTNLGYKIRILLMNECMDAGNCAFNLCEQIADEFFIYNPFLNICNIENPHPSWMEPGDPCCPIPEIHLDPINPGFLNLEHSYTAQFKLSASNVIKPNAKVRYSSQSSHIQLLPGFRAESGCHFRAFIGGNCEPGFTSPSPTELLTSMRNSIDEANTQENRTHFSPPHAYTSTEYSSISARQKMEKTSDNRIFGVTAANPQQIETSQGLFKIAPNPVISTLDISKLVQISNLDAYNVLGVKVATVRTEGKTSVQLDVSSFPQGVFILSGYDEQGVLKASVKFVKQ